MNMSNNLTHVIVPNNLTEHQVTNIRSLLKITVIGHRVATILIQCNGSYELAHDGEFAPMNEV